MKNKLIYIVICVVAAGVLIWFFTKGQLGMGLFYLLILACPLMHIFMMKNMHNASGSQEDQTTKQSKESNNQEKHSCH